MAARRVSWEKKQFELRLSVWGKGKSDMGIKFVGLENNYASILLNQWKQYHSTSVQIKNVVKCYLQHQLINNQYNDVTLIAKSKCLIPFFTLVI